MADSSSSQATSTATMRTAAASSTPAHSGNNSSRQTSTAATTSANAFPQAQGHALRRARTFDDAAAAPMRRRPPVAGASGEASPSSPLGIPRRRSSNFSDYSLGEARGLLNPKAAKPEDHDGGGQDSSLASLSLAFALLPALAGALFKDGSAVVTDIMLLGLAGIFLHWSVTQPWSWYHSAQSVRMQHEASTEAVVDSDESDDDNSAAPGRASSLDDVPEEEETSTGEDDVTPNVKLPATRATSQERAAIAELQTYELLALLSCLALPLLGAYLLHAIRSQLSRPSEGLVSNYNLTIFLLVAELRVFAHMFKLVQSRTLHLQRIVQSAASATANKGSSESSDHVAELLTRLDMLESRSSAEESLLQQGVAAAGGVPDREKQESSIARNVRHAIQPELDALNRAVRRYEKKATLLQMQTEARFSAVDAHLEDAIALAAAAAKSSQPSRNAVLRACDAGVAVLLWPLNTALSLLLLPLKSVIALLNKKNKRSRNIEPRQSRGSRSAGKVVVQGRYSGDRVPSRVMKR